MPGRRFAFTFFDDEPRLEATDLVDVSPRGGRSRRFAFALVDDEPRLEESSSGRAVADALALSETLVKAAQKLAQETAGLSENMATQHIEVPTRGGRSRRFAFAFFDDEQRLEEQPPASVPPDLEETLGMTETLLKRAQKAIAESTTFNEFINQPTTKILAENLSVTEQLVRQVQRRYTETAGFTESLHGSYDLPEINETFSFTENLVKLIVRVASMSETLSFSENLQTAVIPGGPISPYGSRARRFAFHFLDDEPRLEEQPSGGAQEFFLGLSDTVALTENLNKAASTAKTDQPLLIETLVKAVTRAASESIGLSENDIARVTTSLADALSASESLTTVQVKIQSMSDDVGLTESLQKSVTRAVVEAVDLSEDFVPGNNPEIDETIALSETLRASVSKAITEAATLTENADRIAVKLQSVNEAVSATELLSKQVIRAIEETLTPAETFGNVAVTGGAIQESPLFNESTRKDIASAVSETIGMTENFLAGLLRFLNVGDVIGLTEQLVSGLVASGRFKLVEKESVYQLRELGDMYSFTAVRD